MADLSELQSTLPIKIIGADTTGIETTPVNASATGDLSVSDGLNSGGTQGALTLTTANTAYEVKVGAARLSLRKNLTVYSMSARVYWGYTSSVTVASGTPLDAGILQVFDIDATDPNVTVYVICATAGAIVRVTESP